MPRKPKEYALYKGDELLAVGTIREIAEFRGCQPVNLYRMNCPFVKNQHKIRKRKKFLELIKLEDE